jgi:hypothetical protein
MTGTVGPSNCYQRRIAKRYGALRSGRQLALGTYVDRRLTKSQRLLTGPPSQFTLISVTEVMIHE